MIPDFLSLPDGRLAYQRLRGKKTACGLIFLGGYASDMTGTKATFLAEKCRAADISLLRFDYTGHGQSGGDFKKGTIGGWFQDTCAAFDHLTAGPQIVIGSSMGGWLGLMLAQQKPERIKAFIGVAAAPDFTEDFMWQSMTDAQRSRLQQQGFIEDGHTIVTLRLIEEARQHLLLRGSLDMRCPVRLLQGQQDSEVPWQHALRIAEKVQHDNAHITLIKDGDHRLSRPQDLELLWRVVGEFLPP